jgi:hypothetical protein
MCSNCARLLKALPRGTRRETERPVDKFTDGRVHVNIWGNSGVKGAFRTATFPLPYKDNNDECRPATSFGASDLKHLENAAREAARALIIDKRQQDRRTTQVGRLTACHIGTLRAECLDAHWFCDVAEARQRIESLTDRVQCEPSHRALGERTPDEFDYYHHTELRYVYALTLASLRFRRFVTWLGTTCFRTDLKQVVNTSGLSSVSTRARALVRSFCHKASSW